MNLQETKIVIAKWISSCDSSEQLDLLVEIMDRFILERFADQDPTELELVKTDLKQTWMDRKLIVARKRKKSKP